MKGTKKKDKVSFEEVLLTKIDKKDKVTFHQEMFSTFYYVIDVFTFIIYFILLLSTFLSKFISGSGDFIDITNTIIKPLISMFLVIISLYLYLVNCTTKFHIEKTDTKSNKAISKKVFTGAFVPLVLIDMNFKHETLFLLICFFGAIVAVLYIITSVQEAQIDENNLNFSANEKAKISTRKNLIENIALRSTVILQFGILIFYIYVIYVTLSNKSASGIKYILTLIPSVIITIWAFYSGKSSFILSQKNAKKQNSSQSS